MATRWKFVTLRLLARQRQSFRTAALFTAAAVLLLALSACGGSKSSGGGSGSVPTISSFTVGSSSTSTSTSITIASGSSTTLYWSVSNATSLSINGTTVTGSSLSVSPTATTTYTLTATNSYGSSTAQVTVTVTSSSSGVPTISSFTVGSSSSSTSTSITITSGSSTTLYWSVSNATSISIDNGVGTVTGTSVSVSPTATTTYTLTATNSYGSSTAQVTVTVTSSSSGVPTISSFTADSYTITSGTSTTLRWSVSNATSLTINSVISVTGDSSYSISPTLTTIYTLKATNSYGSSTAQLTVTVVGQPTIVTFTPTSSYVAIGSSATLNWTTQNVSTLTLTIGPVSNGGSSTTVDVTGLTSYTYTPVLPSDSNYDMITYTLTGANAAGVTTGAQTTITMEAPLSVSSCSASPATIVCGKSSKLSCDTTGWLIGTYITYASGVTTAEYQGFPVRPTSTATYTMTVSNDVSSVSTPITVYVNPNISNFTATPTTLGLDGSGASLSWNTCGATSLSLAATPSGSTTATTADVTGDTSYAVNPSVTTTYQLTATNSLTSVTSMPATITKTTALDNITSFLAYQTSTPTSSTPAIASTYPGGTVYLIPVFTSGDTAEITDASNNSYCSGSVTSGAACAVTPTASTNYTLTVTNPNYSDATQTQTLRVVVGDIADFAGIGGGIWGYNIDTMPAFTEGGLTTAQFDDPTSITADSSGNAYFFDGEACVVVKVNSSNTATRIAGLVDSCANGSYVDGNALTAATFATSATGGLAADSAGNIYMGDNDAFSGRIRKISGNMVTTVAGNIYRTVDEDGVGSSAGFTMITSLAFDSLGELIVADGGGIRVVDSAGTVTTLVGDADTSNGLGDGTGQTGAGANTATAGSGGLAIDTSTDTIYLAEGNMIRIMTPDKSEASTYCPSVTSPGAACWTWTVSTWLNPSGVSAHVDGSAKTAQFYGTGTSLVRASDGTLFLVDGGGMRANSTYTALVGSAYIRRITPSGVVDTIAQSWASCSLTTTSLGFPYGFCSLPNENNTAAVPLPGYDLYNNLAVDPTQNRLFFDTGDVTSIYTMPY